jgi:predicted nuclease of predicted toxin-antitoxin system
VIELWLDAQLSPALAAWINQEFEDLRAQSVRALGLREAGDREIFFAAREAGAVVVSKDSDVVRLLERHGSPPKVIWLTCGNTSNRNMRSILEKTLLPAIRILQGDEVLVEIREDAT